MNRTTGEYHWHHGYGEHQHYDMDGDGILDCPLKDNTSATYEFTGNTNSGANLLSSAQSVAASFSQKSATTQATVTSRSAPAEPSNDNMAPWIITAVCSIGFLISTRIANSRAGKIQGFEREIHNLTCKYNSLDEEYGKKLRKAQEEIEDLRMRLEKSESSNRFLREHLTKITEEKQFIKQEYERKYKSFKVKIETAISSYTSTAERCEREIPVELTDEILLEMCNAPNGVTFDSRGLPHRIVNGIDDYLVRVSSTGKIHTFDCHYGYGGNIRNAASISETLFVINACSVCRPSKHSLQWYRDYKEIKAGISEK